MPELPEVETIRLGLAPHLEGVRIAHVKRNRPDLRFPLPPRMEARLSGARILPLQRRAKYLLLPLETAETLVIHLGMSGRLLIEAGDETAPLAAFHHDVTRLHAHDHVILTLENGHRLVYNDPRRFGFMLLEESASLPDHTAFAGLGAEPLGNAFNADSLLRALAGRRIPLKAALLDQRIVAGLGNIYVCEALHETGLSPFRMAGTLTKQEAERLVTAIRRVLVAAIEAGGSTLRDYRQGDGALGYFQHEFRVYGREGQACTTPACAGIIERQVQAGRSTFLCATCQN
jgi:formamidopyrimidine-DNA glycosylase